MRRAAVVCLPTYNERDNLEPMVDALENALGSFDVHVLVVDDSSPDGTGKLADRLAEERPSVEVLHRARKEGLGRAYAAGWRHALEHGVELLVFMDCDFSHDPRDVPRLLAAAVDADIVIGSRYVRGGRNRCGSAIRHFLSRAGCLYARVILGVPVRDLTGGFKCFARSALRTIDVDALATRGYGFNIEATYRGLNAGLHVREVPITFAPRRSGRSKMTLAIVVEAAWRVLALRLSRLEGERSARERPVSSGNSRLVRDEEQLSVDLAREAADRAHRIRVPDDAELG